MITDANLERYGITADDLREKMNSNAKVSTSLIAIGEGAEAEWLPRALPGKAHRVKQTSDVRGLSFAIAGASRLLTCDAWLLRNRLPRLCAQY